MTLPQPLVQGVQELPGGAVGGVRAVISIYIRVTCVYTALRGEKLACSPKPAFLAFHNIGGKES